MKLLTTLSATLLLATLLFFNCCKKENLNPVTMHKSEAGNTITAVTVSDSSYIYIGSKEQFLRERKGRPSAFHLYAQINRNF